MTSRARAEPEVDYEDPAYWNRLIKMSLSKFFILCVLNARSMHGYDISKAVETVTQGCCSPTPGTLYPVLKEFEAGGYVTCVTETVSGRQRKVYTITDKGRRAFKVGVQAWMEAGACITANSDGAYKGEGCC